MTDEEQDSLSKTEMLKILDAVCNTDVLFGDMSTSNSPLDVLFFPTHNEVERIFQRKMLSATMTDKSWPYSKFDCPGQKPEWKNLWFDYTFDDDSTISSDLTNKQLLNLLDPASHEHVGNMNYVYNNFNWSHCTAYSSSEVTDYSSTMDGEDWVWKSDEGLLANLGPSE